MKSLVALLLLAACTGGEGDDYPVLGAGGGSSGHGINTTTTVIVGRVCLTPDLLSVTTCANNGLANVTVSTGGQVVTTASDGTFRIIAPDLSGSTTSRTTFVVSGATIVPSSATVATVTGTGSPIDVTVPVITQDLFNRIALANGIQTLTGSGSIVATVVRGGVPVSGVTAISTPSPAFGPFFDGTTPNSFTLNGTGQRGVVFFPGVTVGPAALTFTDLATSGETTVDGIQVINGGITFMDAILP